MYKLYCFGDFGDEYNTYFEIERETMKEIQEWIEDHSWFCDWRDKSFQRTNFTPLRLTKFKETTIMDKDNPWNKEAMDRGLARLQEEQRKKDARYAKEIKEKELKQLEELKRKYES